MAKQSRPGRGAGKPSSFGKRQSADNDFRKKKKEGGSSYGKKDGDSRPRTTKGGKFRSTGGPRSSEGGERREYGSSTGRSNRSGTGSSRPYGRRNDDSSGERRGSGSGFRSNFRSKPDGERRESPYSRGAGSGGPRKYGNKFGDKSGSGSGEGRSERPYTSRSNSTGGPRKYGSKFGDKSGSGSGEGRSERPYTSRSNSTGGPRKYGSKFGDKSGSGSGEGRSERPYTSRGNSTGGPRKYGSKFGDRSERGGEGNERRERKDYGSGSSSGRSGGRGYSDRDKDKDDKAPRFRGKTDSEFNEEKKEPENEGEAESRPAKRAPRERRSFVESKVASAKERSNTDEPVAEATDKDALIRLNKFISNSGVCSRREADELIKLGLISVNGTTITEMGYKVKPTDDIRHEGKKLNAERPVYILLNKPKGFITTTDDPQDRNTVMHLISGACKERVYPVGRLDRNTTGLLLLTNDGDLTDKLTHPSFNAKKIYKVELDKPITRDDFQKIQEGIHLEEGRAMVDDLAIVSDDNKTVGIELHIGWNHVVRRIFDSLGYAVVKLDRVVYAGLDKSELKRGQWRFLRTDEIVRLKHFK